MRETLAVIIGATIAILLFIGGITWLKAWINSSRCYAAYDQYRAEWGFFSGCRIEWNGKLTPVNIIREIE